MKKLSTLIALFLLFSSALFAQVGINNNNSSPDASAMLDVKSTNKGFLPPRTTKTHRNSIGSLATGTSVAGGKMKSVSALWTSPNTDATNNSGFSGLPGGSHGISGSFGGIGGSGKGSTHPVRVPAILPIQENGSNFPRRSTAQPA